MNLTKRELDLYKKIISFGNVKFSMNSFNGYENEFYKLLMYNMIILVFDYEFYNFMYSINKENKYYTKYNREYKLNKIKDESY